MNTTKFDNANGLVQSELMHLWALLNCYRENGWKFTLEGEGLASMMQKIGDAIDANGEQFEEHHGLVFEHERVTSKIPFHGWPRFNGQPICQNNMHTGDM